MKRYPTAVPIAVLLSVAAYTQQPKYQQGAPDSGAQGTAKNQSSAAAQKPGRFSYSPQFTAHDRDTINNCMRGRYGTLPPGLADRPLPPSLEKQLQMNGQLPPGLQKRAQALPDLCNSRLVNLPVNWTRVIVGRDVLLLDPSQKIADMFSLD